MREYKVGDKVTIRSWESMEREFGADGSDDLNCGFVSAMRHICGISTTISEVHKSGVYNVLNGEFFAFTQQMFTDWETDNANEEKMKYNGQEVELITEGYWPEGETLICSDDGIDWLEKKAICLHNGICLYADRNDGDSSVPWKYWALLPAKQAPRRLTNRELGKLVYLKYDLKYRDGSIYCNAEITYTEKEENEPCDVHLLAVRAPNTDEWLEPTSDLLEVGK